MKRTRLAMWSAVAGLTLVAGCQSCSTNSCGESPGILSRLGLRPRTSETVIYDGPAGGSPYTAPIGTAPGFGADCPCSAGGGPVLGGQPFMPVPGTPVAPPMLPPPYPGSTAPLVPVPNGNGQASPVPAPPTSRRGGA